MKKKLTKIIGIGFALVLVASMMLFAIPAAAGPYLDLAPQLPNMWAGFAPTPSAFGAWFFDPAITQVGPLAKAINGDIYAYVAGTAATPTAQNPGTNDIFKSIDGGHTWTVSTIPFYFVNSAFAATASVKDMVCSDVSEDVVYLTDGNYVYKSINGGLSFFIVAEDSLETILTGTCGPSVVLTGGAYINCIDIGYNAAGEAYIFIGVNGTDQGAGYDTDYPSVLYINEDGYPSTWADLKLHCFHNDVAHSEPAGGYVPLSIGVAPNFDVTKKIYVLVTNSDDLSDHPDVVDARTYVVSNVGVECSWAAVDELLWDCNSANNFQTYCASRFAFTSEFATLGNVYIGVTAWDNTAATFETNTPGGDVYVAYDTIVPAQDALDLNVQGYTSACIGIFDANICSLDVSEDDELMAGAYDNWHFQSPTRVYYSADGGWTWSPSLKDPTGGVFITDVGDVGMTYVLFGSAVAGTSGCDCAFSMSCGDVVGQYWNQISLISMSIDEVLDLSHAPGYVLDSSIMYVLTYDYHACASVDINSLLRWDGTYWERVHSTRSYYGLGAAWLVAPLYDWVEVSPDFNDTDCLYMANTNFQMIRSTDMGCSWRPLAYPCAPLPTISAWIVVDEETVLASGSPSGLSIEFVYKTTRHGTRPWSMLPVLNSLGLQIVSDGVDFDLSPSIATDNNVLLGDDYGRVFLSQDLGETPWAEIADIVGFAPFNASAVNTYVVFDPGFGTADDPGENMIYAAGGTLVGRCNLDLAMPLSMQDWVYISSAASTCDPFDLKHATGIDAVGDTVLYVADLGYDGGPSGDYTISGTIAVMYYYDADVMTTCDIEVNNTTLMGFTPIAGTGAFVAGEPLNILSYNLQCTDVPWGLTAPAGYGNSISGELVVQGFVSGAQGILYINEYLGAGVFPHCEFCYGLDAAFVLISGVLTMDTVPDYIAYGPTGVWRTVNPMDPMPPAFPVPLVEWEFLTRGLNPLTGLPLQPPVAFRHPEAGLAGGLGVYPDDLWLTKASNMLWALDENSSYDMYIWMWEDPLATPVIQIAPADGALLATTTTVTLEWEALDLATYYEVLIFEACPGCVSPAEMRLVIEGGTSQTCLYNVTGLLPGTKYYWKVRVACDSPFVSKWSDLRFFNTALETVPYLCAPWCGQDDVNINTNFAWDAVLGANSYEVQIATDDAFSSIVSSGTTSANAWVPADPLDYSTVYYWRVRAVNDGVYSAWAVCIFTTAAEPVEPAEPPPAVIIEETEITPTWIWVIIGIGGALTIAVVILIVTTRRVP